MVPKGVQTHGKGTPTNLSELTEFIAMKGQATTFGLDYLPNIKKEERVATERPLRHTNLPISHPKSTLVLTSSSSEPIQPRPCQGENTKYVCGRSGASVLNIFP